jgi:multiple sugar transport system permease protein
MPSLPRLTHHNRLLLLLAPYLAGIILLVALPAAMAFGLAFFQYDAISPPRFVGGLNFILAYTDELFGLSVQNSLSLVLLPAPLRVLGAFLAARLFQAGGRYLAPLRAAIFLPSVLPAAAFALAWLWILNPLFGPLNLILRAAGFDAPAWLADPAWARPALVLISLWQIGEGFLVCLAALLDIPPELDDAARIDGAGTIARIWYLALPLVAPVLLLLLFRDAILALQDSFTTILLTTQGGPYYATYTLPLFVYEQGFDLLSFGTASAALWVLYALAGTCVLLLYLVARQWQIGTTEGHFLL